MIATLLALLAVVNTPNNSVSYACDGATAAYTVSFPYLASSDLIVTSVTAGGVVTTLTSVTDYSTSLASTSSTATLTLNSPSTKCPAGSTLRIVRTVALTQPTGFRGQTTFNGNLHETAYDREVMQIQQLQALYTNPPATVLPSNVVAKLNNIRFADQFANIQAAITDAGVTGSVIIPSSYAGVDTYVNTSAIPIIDLRGGPGRWRSALSVRSDFGATCDGSTDDAGRLATASAAAVTANAVLVIDCKVRLASAAGTVGANLRFAPGGALDVSTAGGSVTLTGLVDAPMTKIFYTGAGTLTMNGFTRTLWVLPQWWGAQGIGGATDDGPALQAAINSVSSTTSFRGVVYLPPGAYRYTTPLLHQQDIAIRGSGPKFGGTSLQPDGCAAFKAIGASYAGGFAFRATISDLVIQPLNTPANTKLVELNNAYSINFINVLLSSVADNGSIGFDATDVNELVFEGVRIDGASNSTAKGIVLHVGADKTSAQCVHCDIENLSVGIENLDASVVDIISPYMERNITAVKNSSNLSGTLGGGHLLMTGGVIHCPGGAQVCVSTTGSAPTTVIGTTLNNGGGVGNKFATGTTSLINYFDTATNRWFFGTAPTGSNNLTPASTISLGTQNSVNFVGHTFATLGAPGNGTFGYCSDCTIANPCAGGGTGAFWKRLNGVFVCN